MVARGTILELRLLLDCGDPPARPGVEDGVEERAAVGKSSIEAALGYAEVLGQNFNPYLVDAAARQGRQAGFDPFFGSIAVGHGAHPYDTVPY